MTENQKQYVIRARQHGTGYKTIAKTLGIPLTTVQSFCKRNNVEAAKEDKKTGCCKNCGSPIVSILGRKARQFCSRECGLLWWHAHPEQINQKALYKFTCAECGKPFTSYGAKNRKYCSISCYANHRLKGAGHASR